MLRARCNNEGLDNMATTGNRFSGKVVLVTGGGRGVGTGIGSDICARFAAEGAFVIVNYLDNPPAAEGVVAKIEADGGSAVAMQADISSVDEIKKLFRNTDEYLTSKFGTNKIDILINNACIIWPHDICASEEIYDQMLDVNLKGPFFVASEIASRMPDGGRIINISSQGGRVAHPVVPLYSIAKHCTTGLTRNLALLLGHRNICVNGLEPGMTMSDAYMENMKAVRGFATGSTEDRADDGIKIQQPPELPGGGYDLGPELNATVKSIIALGRIASPREVSAVVLFLASDDARWITGQTFAADGGMKL